MIKKSVLYFEQSEKFKLCLFLAFISLFLFVAVAGARAEDATRSGIQKYNISFPIVELGNCASFAECRTYCEDPVNRNSCIDFAKKKGFYKIDEITNQAKKEIGCTSYESCRQFCAEQENFDRCNSFVRKHNFGGGYGEDPENKDILEKAKKVLQCNSYQSCKNLCSSEDNKDRCEYFAKQAGLRAGIKPQISSVQSSLEQICKKTANCKWKEDKCHCSAAGGLGRFGDVDEYCQKHPDICKNLDLSKIKEEYCQKFPEKCRIATASADFFYKDEVEKICKAYPEKCGLLKPSKVPKLTKPATTSAGVRGISTTQVSSRQFLNNMLHFVQDLFR